MGKGLISCRQIPQNTFVIEYKGDLITNKTEFDRRNMQLMKEGKDCYLMEIKIKNGKKNWSVIITWSKKLIFFNFIISIDLFNVKSIFHMSPAWLKLHLNPLSNLQFLSSRLDASDPDIGKARFINHLRRGFNLRHKIIYDLNDAPHVAFFANQRINKGDFLYYNYNEGMRPLPKTSTSWYFTTLQG